MYCTKCGKEIPFGSDACTHCGAQLNQPQSAPQQTNIYDTEDNSPLSMGAFLIMMLIAVVPLVNIVMFCIWAFGSEANVNRKNYARAYLIMLCISFVFFIVFYAAIFGAILSAINQL